MDPADFLAEHGAEAFADLLTTRALEPQKDSDPLCDPMYPAPSVVRCIWPGSVAASGCPT